DDQKDHLSARSQEHRRAGLYGARPGGADASWFDAGTDRQGRRRVRVGDGERGGSGCGRQIKSLGRGKHSPQSLKSKRAASPRLNYSDYLRRRPLRPLPSPLLRKLQNQNGLLRVTNRPPPGRAGRLVPTLQPKRSRQTARTQFKAQTLLIPPVPLTYRQVPQRQLPVRPKHLGRTVWAKIFSQRVWPKARPSTPSKARPPTARPWAGPSGPAWARP